jgi:hypothetical protein
VSPKLTSRIANRQIKPSNRKSQPLGIPYESQVTRVGISGYSFKKVAKKLLLTVGAGPAVATARGKQKFFASFFSKKEALTCLA